MKDTNRALLGEDIIDKTGELYGLDEEGELRSSYRPSGQPGVSLQRVLSQSLFLHIKLTCMRQLWYATGDFFQGRFMSKILVGVQK